MRRRLARLVVMMAGLALGYFGYVHAYPRLVMDRLADRLEAAGVNVLTHRRNLLTPADRGVVKPNNDTLYSSALLDLSDGPVRLDLPDFGTRYWSVQVIDMWTGAPALASRRTMGPGAHSLVLARRPADAPDAEAILLEDRRYWLLIRILIDGPDDLDAVHALQDAIRLTPAP